MDMKKERAELVNYRLSHELWNSITHGLGALFGVAALILMLLKVLDIFVPFGHHYEPGSTNFTFALVAVLIYGISIMICMTISCIYHALAKNKGKKVLRILDHDMIFLLIAGTYTPFTLITMRDLPLWGIESLNFSGWIIFGLVWALIILGVTMNSINLEKYKILSMAIYVGVGWIIMLNCVEFFHAISSAGFFLLLAGGVAYTIGAVLYGLGKKKSLWFHTVFHFFVLAGVVLHFLSIYLFVL